MPKSIGKKWLTGRLLLAAVLGVCGPAWAQDADSLRIYEEELRVELDKQAPADREIGFDAGGWLNFALFHYKDWGNFHQRTLRQYQARGWASLNIKGVHKVYFRGLLNWDNWADDDNPRMRSDTDFDESVERAWYEFDLSQMLRQINGSAPPVGFRMKVGREFTTIGTGLVLSMPLDMLDFYVTFQDFQFRALLGKTDRNTTNLDWSDRVASRSERCFYGFELTYKGFTGHRPFAYFLSNHDHTSPKWPDPIQRYDYSSRYLGVGSSGTLFVPQLSYRTEFVGEWGRTFSELAIDRQDEICAYAGDIELEYLFDVTTKPRVGFEYLFASGDSDRRASTNSTVGGNLAGTRDTAFNAFGFRDTGISFAPRISNLHLYRINARFLPFEGLSVDLLKKLELGTAVYFYQKHKAKGPVSDTTATTNSPWLGWEWDVYCNWRLTSDLSWSCRYGCFQPGAAFEGQRDAPRHFFYTAVSLSF